MEIDDDAGASASRRWWSGCCPPSAGWPRSSRRRRQPCRRVDSAERPLDQLLRAGAGLGGAAHRPPSCTVLRMLTPRNSADGQPWLTGATWPGLGLAAVERAAEHVGLRPADGRHRAPEVRRRRLVGHVAQLAGEPPVLDPVEPLAGELEVVALHVDRPALVADDVDAALDAGDEVLGRAGRPGPAAARRWPSAAPARGPASRRTRSRWSGPARAAGPCSGRSGSRPGRRRATMSHCWPATPSSSQPTVDSPCSAVRSPVTFITGEPYCRRAELVDGGERRPGVGRLVAERPVELGGVPDRLVDGQPQVGRVDDQVVAAGLDRRRLRLLAQQLGDLGQLGAPVPAGRRSGTPSRGRPAGRGCACSRTRRWPGRR